MQSCVACAEDAYYACDARVRFELCVPIIDATDTVLGIIDIEAWKPRLLTDDQINQVFTVCRVLADDRLGLRHAPAAHTLR